jgi:hypothetical protein
MTPYSLVNKFQPTAVILETGTLHKEVVWCTGTYQTTQSHNPEDCNLRNKYDLY